uniref:ATP synthase complex subunit 8 n=1 Tax=Philolithus actuosus TaxID=1271693 RepID=A0A8F3JCX8_9CUCU|nr:ATP synthase F0 subunit 8 [Philolithus actuosus]QWZ46391.1 ATP synthase F0 subunit 8 [Philolithus actuosus]
MPQMAPLNWLTLMLFFISVFLTFNIMNYYSFNYNIPVKKTISIKKFKINWKW